MSKQLDHDAEFTALQTEINKAYHQQPLEQPSAELDEAILAKARSDANVSKVSSPKKSMWQRNAWVFSSAASVLLVAGLFMLTPSLQKQVGIDIEQGLPAQQSSFKQAKSTSDVPKLTESPVEDAAAAESIAVQGLSMSSVPMNNERVNRETISEASDNNGTVESKMADKSSAVMSAAPTPAKVNEEAQNKVLELHSRSHDKEGQQVKQSFNGSLKGDIQLDTADVALARLQALMADNKLIQAERYMITIDQRFPELSDPSHPLYEQYHKIVLQLTSQ
ncbi:hypothetical protein CXF80_08305 [Shewanella sp. Actino-trap-3]|jgi:hypothetical protein|uniref:hypothetical protein n=1 Tax=Shewanella sp. Actino-trap-3 TaxID=2058331 RepID=UPI000C33A510|nr:hypothetical protein [Shewanella sp. Actino-trap-3]PKG78317.1 hypothetical protein CXF80_08305 [Shewanella sp. Actino-trap-3]|tara:strand:+ start:19606 stop:20439 length:834 start_codon:yes stop_codon:yes gene_type:complete